MDGPLGQKSKKLFRSAFGSNKNKKIIFWNLLTFRINQIYQITDSIVNIVLKFECPLWNSNLELLTTTSVLWFLRLTKNKQKKWSKTYMKPAKIQIQMGRDYYEFN